MKALLQIFLSLMHLYMQSCANKPMLSHHRNTNSLLSFHSFNAASEISPPATEHYSTLYSDLHSHISSSSLPSLLFLSSFPPFFCLFIFIPSHLQWLSLEILSVLSCMPYTLNYFFHKILLLALFFVSIWNHLH